MEERSLNNAYEGGGPGCMEKLCTVDEKDKWFFEAMKDVPKVHFLVAIVAAPLNILFPGLGLIICALLAQDVSHVSKI